MAFIIASIARSVAPEKLKLPFKFREVELQHFICSFAGESVFKFCYNHIIVKHSQTVLV